MIGLIIFKAVTPANLFIKWPFNGADERSLENPSSAINKRCQQQ
jgi:hypothetical protein